MYRILHNLRNPGWHRQVFDGLADHLTSTGRPTTVERVDAVTVTMDGRRTEVRHDFRAAFVVAADGGRTDYAILDFQEQVGPSRIKARRLLADPDCRVMLKAQCRLAEYGRPPFDKVRAWTYFEKDPLAVQARVDELRAVPRTEPGLFFRGTASFGGRGPILARLRPVLAGRTGKVPMADYLATAARHRVALGLPGVGNSCHREVELFGIGTPVLMPRLKNDYFEPLVPDVHYVSVAVDAVREPPGVVAEKLAARYAEVAGGDALLASVVRAAADWYDRNVRFPASLALTARLLGL